MTRFEGQVINQIGVPINGVTVTVRVANATPGTGALATLYSDNGVTTTTNPVTADSNGRYWFYVADGKYDITFSGTGLTTYIRANIEIADLTSANSADSDWLANKVKATTGVYIGTNPSATGAVGLANGGTIKSRNAANSADITLMSLDASNVLNLYGTWGINSSGHLIALTDNVGDIGASGATRPRAVYVGTKVQTPRLRIGTPSQDFDNTITFGTNVDASIIVDQTDTGTKIQYIQAGGGSAGYGGGITLYGHAHASFPGWVKAGISAGSGGKFSVNSQGVGSGIEAFTVTAAGVTQIGDYPTSDAWVVTPTGKQLYHITAASIVKTMIDSAGGSSWIGATSGSSGAGAKWLLDSSGNMTITGDLTLSPGKVAQTLTGAGVAAASFANTSSTGSGVAVTTQGTGTEYALLVRSNNGGTQLIKAINNGTVELGASGLVSVASGDVSLNGLILTGTASHSASVRYIDAGGTASSIQYNVPTGGSHAFSVNGVNFGILTGSTTTLNLIAPSGNNQAGILFSGSGIARHYLQFVSTGANLVLAVENSAGTGFVTGGLAYGGVVGTLNATPLELVTNAVVRVSFDSAGAGTVSGSWDKAGTASITTDSAGINTTETVVVKSGVLSADRLVAGTVLRVVMLGTCTASAANTSTFQIRIGTAGSTADTLVFSGVTATSATTGTAIPFRAILELTVRTTGASATAMGFLTVETTGGTATGISIIPVQVILPTMTTFNTTTASNIISATYKSAATTTTCTFKEAFIEVVYK